MTSTVEIPSLQQRYQIGMNLCASSESEDRVQNIPVIFPVEEPGKIINFFKKVTQIHESHYDYKPEDDVSGWHNGGPDDVTKTVYVVKSNSCDDSGNRNPSGGKRNSESDSESEPKHRQPRKSKMPCPCC